MATVTDDALTAAVRTALPTFQKSLDACSKRLYEEVLPKLVELREVSGGDTLVAIRDPLRMRMRTTDPRTSEEVLLPVFRHVHERRTWSVCSQTELTKPATVADDLALRACDAVLCDVLRRATVAEARVPWIMVPSIATARFRPGDSTKCLTFIGPDGLSKALAADALARDVLRPYEVVTWKGSSVAGAAAPRGRVVAGACKAELHTAIKPTLTWDRASDGRARLTVLERSCLVVKEPGAVLEIC